MADIPDAWADPIIVTSPESEDGAPAAVWRCTVGPLTAPPAGPFETARTAGSAPAAGEWVFHLDPEERVPRAVMEAQQRLIQERGDSAEPGSGGGM